MKELISLRDVQKAIGLEKYGLLGKGIASLVMRLTHLNKLNKVHDQLKDLPPKDFLDRLPEVLGCNYQIYEDDLKRIPSEGAFITISNHPLGGLDGILLLKMITDVRPDYKVMANFLLANIENLKPYFLPVNPFETLKHKKSSFKGIRNALQLLENGSSLGIFPAGEVSTYRQQTHCIADRQWNVMIIKLIQKAEVPVIPVYFHARNSKLFYFLARINPWLRTAMLPREMMRGDKKRHLIKVRIGKPIYPKEMFLLENPAALSDFLRQKTYMLANAFCKKKLRLKTSSIAIKSSKRAKEKTIVKAQTLQLLQQDIDCLRQKKEALLFSNGSYEVFFSSAERIPNILYEIGRLRETTFREIGEGTNQAIDLDRYDQYYHHLFVWDNKECCIVGAYRMGLGDKIYKKYGGEGFYLSELFRFDTELQPLFARTIEMGRAFVEKRYQQKPMPLFLLWKGIVYVTLRNPQYRFLIGGVSISNQFSDFSKSVIVEFMKSHYFDAVAAQYIRPRNVYKVRLKMEDKNFIWNTAAADINKFDKLIDEIEPGKLRLPVLLKKYIKQNARIVAFNVDPKFNDAIDGLMYIRIADLPESTVRPIVEEIEEKTHQLEKEE